MRLSIQWNKANWFYHKSNEYVNGKVISPWFYRLLVAGKVTYHNFRYMMLSMYASIRQPNSWCASRWKHKATVPIGYHHSLWSTHTKFPYIWFKSTRAIWNWFHLDTLCKRFSSEPNQVNSSICWYKFEKLLDFICD